MKGRCVAQTRKNRRRPSCTRYATVLAGIAGARGAVGRTPCALPKPNGRKLRKGRYRLTLTANDATGAKVTATVRFRVT